MSNRKNAPQEITFNGKTYPSKRKAAEDNHERLDMTFRRLYTLIQRGARADDELGRRHSVRFYHEGRWWSSIKEYAGYKNYSASYMSAKLKEEGVIP